MVTFSPAGAATGPETRARTDPEQQVGSPAVARRGYAGPDRRRRVPATRLRRHVIGSVAAVTVVGALWVVLAAATTSRGPAEVLSLMSLTRSITGAFLLAAAALCLAVWRIVGTSRAGCAVVALSVAGIATPMLTILGRRVVAGSSPGDVTAATAGAVDGTLIACAAAALVLPTVVSRLRPLLIAVPIMTGYVLVASGILLSRRTDPGVAWLQRVDAALPVVTTAAWTVVAVGYLLRGCRRRRRSDLVLGCAMLVMVARTAACAAMGTVHYQIDLAAAGYDAIVATAILCAAMIALWHLHSASRTRLLRAESQLDETRTDLAELTDQQAQRLHDARNALFAIAGATQLLAHPDEISGSDADHLHQLVVAELNRLGAMLDPSIYAAPQRFSISDLLLPIVAAYRAQGMTIAAHIDDCTLDTQRDALANAVGNLLTNARVHAPGARVWVTVRRTASADAPTAQVHLTIADDGPGIPEVERAAVLRPGVRGSGATAVGSGLGLASATRMVRDLGGVLRLAERPGGGTSVTLTLPVAEPARGARPGDEQWA